MVAVHDGGGHGSPAVDEDTDVALLDQHLLKTNALTKRMTTILSRLDSRLSRLDKTIAPLGIRDMARLQANIDAALNQLTAPPGEAGSRPQMPPQVRQGSYGSISNGHGASGSAAASIAHSTAGHSVSGHSGSVSTLSTEPTGLGLSGTQLPSPHRAAPVREPSQTSILERTRAVPTRDTLPRWTDSPGARNSTMSRTPSNQTVPTTQTQRSPAVDSPHSSREQTMVSPLPVPSGSERAILNRGIDLMAVGEFYGAMLAVVQDIEQMQRGIAEGRAGQREAGITELCTLLESSMRQAVDLVVKTVRDTLPRAFDPGQYASGTPNLATYYPPYNTIRPLSSPLAGLAYPEPPTPRAAQVITPIMDELIADVAQIRGDWLRKSMSGLATRVEEADATVYEGRGGEKVRLCMKMWDTFLTVCECEANLSSTIMPGPAGQKLAGQTLPYVLSILSQTMNHVLAGIKRNLSAQTMTMLDLYASLITFQPRYESSIASHFPDAKDLQTALTGSLNALRGMALRSFPERLVDIRSPPRSGMAPSSAISETTYNTLAYLEALPSFGNLVETLLRSSGHVERAWLMGAAAPPSTAKSAATEGGLINLYAADVLGTLLSHLETQCKMMRRPIGPTFLINNVSHIRNAISSFKDDIIGPGAEDMLNKRFRDAKTMYTAEWKSLTQTLQHVAQSRFNVPGTSHDKQSTKEASAAFFDRLAEMEQLCRQYPLNRQDPDLRDRIGREVDELVKNSYTPFWNKAHSKGLDKYLRATPDEISRRVRAVFR